MTNKTFSALPLAATLLLFSASASAEEIKLRVADTFPAGHFISENLTKVWMARVAELTDGKVTFDYFTSGQLGKIPQMMDLVQNDIVDIAYVPPSSYADRVPLAGVGELPGFFTDAATGGAAFQKLLRTDLIKTEFDQYGVAPLFGCRSIRSRSRAIPSVRTRISPTSACARPAACWSWPPANSARLRCRWAVLRCTPLSSAERWTRRSTLMGRWRPTS